MKEYTEVLGYWGGFISGVVAIFIVLILAISCSPNPKVMGYGKQSCMVDVAVEKILGCFEEPK